MSRLGSPGERLHQSSAGDWEWFPNITGMISAFTWICIARPTRSLRLHPAGLDHTPFELGLSMQDYPAYRAPVRIVHVTP